jgi:hypothetical protein
MCSATGAVQGAWLTLTSAGEAVGVLQQSPAKHNSRPAGDSSLITTQVKVHRVLQVKYAVDPSSLFAKPSLVLDVIGVTERYV